MYRIEVHWHLHSCIGAHFLPQIVPHKSTHNQFFYSYSVLGGEWKCRFHHLELCRVFLFSVEYKIEFYYCHLKLVLELFQLIYKVNFVCMYGWTNMGN